MFLNSKKQLLIALLIITIASGLLVDTALAQEVVGVAILDEIDGVDGLNMISVVKEMNETEEIGVTKEVNAIEELLEIEELKLEELLVLLMKFYQTIEEISTGEIAKDQITYIIDLWYEKVQDPPLTTTPLVDLHDEDTLATENFIYTLLDNHLLDTNSISITELADILADEVELTYNNYLYYRCAINDTASLNIIKLYSEGILETDANGNIYPDKELSRKEAMEIISKLPNPIVPERPECIERKNIPILMYHEINLLPKNGPTGLYVRQDNFIKQLDTLKEEGYHTITMNQLYEHWENNMPIPLKPIVLSFDDGYASHYDFASIELNKRGMTGTFYIISSAVEVDQIRTAQRLKKMYEEGMEIGSHTVTHADARYSSKAKIVSEYRESKEYLEEITGSEIRHFCYPIGGVTAYAKQVLMDLDYKTAVRTTYGKANKSQGMYDFRRIRIDYNDSIKGFLNKIK